IPRGTTVGEQQHDAASLARDEARFAEISAALGDAIDAVLEGRVLRVVTRRCAEAGVALDDRAGAMIAAVAAQCRAEVTPRVRALLGADLDEQRSTPLALLRGAVVFPTDVLRSLGVPPVDRDEFAVRAFPEDLYALSAANFGDLDESVHEPGIVWGAAKAHVHLARRAARSGPRD